jgi:tetratricopeptide (TPR) repeat protein
VRAPILWSPLALAIMTSCSTPPEASALPVALNGVLLAGCDEMIADGEAWACGLERSDTEPVVVRVWVPPGSPPWIRVNGEATLPKSVRGIDGGALVEVELPFGAETLAVERGEDSLRPTERWTLAVRWRDPTREPPPVHAEKTAMYAAHAEERWEVCQQEAARVRESARAAGRGLTEVHALQNGIMCSINRGDIEAARALAVELEQLPSTADEREVTRAYMSGMVLLEQGALHEAIVTLRRGLNLSERLAMTTFHAEHLSMLSLTLAELGDVDGAVAAATAALDREAHPYVDPCEDAALRINLAWVSILGTEVRLAERVPDPATELLRALEAFEGPQAVCAHEESAAKVGLNLARAALLHGDHQEVERWLARVSDPIEQAGSMHLREELHIVRAQHWIAVGDLARAREALERPSDTDVLPHDLRLSRWIVQGELAESEGDLDAAKAFYRRAHAWSLERVGSLAHDDGRLRFIYDRLRGTQRLVALLAGPRGDPESAFAVAREAAGREARMLAASHRALHGPAIDPTLEAMRREYLAVRDSLERRLEQRWDLRPEVRHDLRARARPEERVRFEALLAPVSPGDAAEALRPPVPGELLLSFFPMPGGRRLGFAASVDGVRLAWLDVPLELLRPEGHDPEGWRGRWAAHLLEPFAEAIEGAERIRVLPSFGLELLPFHALPWRGRPLLRHAAVEHAVDLPGATAPALAGPTRALVVGDPQGDLADARVEAETVADVLEQRGLEVEALLGPAASGMALREALVHADILHYAGHAATAGTFGWESTLNLADYGRLEIGDLFVLDHIPAQVVLTACRSAARASGPRERGISLAEAFVLAGSRAVVAASVDLDAAEVSSLGSLVHRDPGRTATHDLADAYRDAMLRWHDTTGTTPTWEALRLWVP